MVILKANTDFSALKEKRVYGEKGTGKYDGKTARKFISCVGIQLGNIVKGCAQN